MLHNEPGTNYVMEDFESLMDPIGKVTLKSGFASSVACFWVVKQNEMT